MSVYIPPPILSITTLIAGNNMGATNSSRPKRVRGGGGGLQHMHPPPAPRHARPSAQYRDLPPPQCRTASPCTVHADTAASHRWWCPPPRGFLAVYFVSAKNRIRLLGLACFSATSQPSWLAGHPTAAIGMSHATRGHGVWCKGATCPSGTRGVRASRSAPSPVRATSNGGAADALGCCRGGDPSGGSWRTRDRAWRGGRSATGELAARREKEEEEKEK